MNRQYFDPLDMSILQALTKNARTPYLEIARDFGVSGAAVHQRVQRLLANKVIIGSQCQLEPTALGFNVMAFIGVSAMPGTDIERLAEELAQIEEITECHIVTGRFDIIVKLNAPDNRTMLELIRDRMLPLNIASTETMVSFREAFNRPMPIRNE